MLEVTCSDLGGSCGHVARGETVAELKQAVFAHAQEAHPEMLAEMSDEDKKQLDAMLEQRFA